MFYKSQELTLLAFSYKLSLDDYVKYLDNLLARVNSPEYETYLKYAGFQLQRVKECLSEFKYKSVMNSPSDLDEDRRIAEAELEFAKIKLDRLEQRKKMIEEARAAIVNAQMN